MPDIEIDYANWMLQRHKKNHKILKIKQIADLIDLNRDIQGGSRIIAGAAYGIGGDDDGVVTSDGACARCG